MIFTNVNFLAVRPGQARFPQSSREVRMACYSRERVLLTSWRQKSHRGYEFLLLPIIQHPSSLLCQLQKRSSEAEIGFYLAVFTLIAKKKKNYLSRNIFLNDGILITSPHKTVHISSLHFLIKVDI